MYCSVCNPPVQGRLRCRIRLFLAARVFVSKCECVYLYECECLLSAWLSWYSVCLVSLLIYYGRIWVALSYYFLHFSACLMFAVVVVVVLVDAVIILFCVCLCEWLSDCARVCVRNNWNSTTVIVCLCLIKNYRWIRSDLSKKHSSVALMVLLCRFFTVAMETKILQYRLFEKLKRKSGKGTI